MHTVENVTLSRLYVYPIKSCAKEPVRTLATYRKSDGEVFFGRNLIHDTLCTVHVGDPVETTPR